ncbi:MAG: PA0069 family radical SAM protein [Alphaproteobacteria bacterium]|nr:PA0069 family radical SAM protein [Alphaproteobacteria bacterium]
MADGGRSLARKGRGATSNDSGRYERERRVLADDGWGSLDADPPPLRTEIILDKSRTIIARNRSPDVPFDRSINPYRGCEHGCVYCFARPTHAWLGYSPGLDFESRIFVKPEAPALLERELAKPGYRCRPIAMGTNTDPYQPIEKRAEITRGILDVLSAHNHPLSIVTKSALVLRDRDLLVAMAERNLVKVFVSITTLDRKLARLMEPRAAAPGRRLDTLRGLAAAGIPTGVMAAPMIPALNDIELEAILEAARDAGAGAAGYILLRLPLEIKDLFTDWLREHYPDRADRVLSLIRQTRGGALYKDSWGQRMTGSGPVADLVARRFAAACRRLGLDRNDRNLDTTHFKPPAADKRQLDLL